MSKFKPCYVETERSYHYEITLSNQCLGLTRVLKAKTEEEVVAKAEELEAKWNIQVAKKHAERESEEKTMEVEAQIAALSSILSEGITRDHRQTFQEPKKQPFADFTYKEPPEFSFETEPTYEEAAKSLSVPKPSFLERLSPGLKARRLALEEKARKIHAESLEEHAKRKAEAQERFHRSVADYDADRKAALREYEERKAAHEKAHAAAVQAVRESRQRFENGDPDAIVDYLRRVVTASEYPAGIRSPDKAKYEPASGTAVIDQYLPNPEEFPRVERYRYVAARIAVEPVEMSKREFEAFYDSVIYQLALLTLFKVFQSVELPQVKAAVFNGWVKGVDSKTGKDFTSCTISVMATREQLQAIDLARVVPKDCFRGLKGLSAGPLASLAPVKPVMNLNTEDPRFIESRQVLADLNATDNLATMEWDDFEHLVRELFEKEFSQDGAEVKVTQSSRDKGVDAIAFDPDPIRGGKFVIQAKRYNIVVPVSAVRDLYGTMINEGAAKGILVATSYFGSDSYDFAKDKPIALIDGSNLVQMFSRHGYDVRIELQKGSEQI